MMGIWHLLNRPDNISIELIQKDGSLPAQEPWVKYEEFQAAGNS